MAKDENEGKASASDCENQNAGTTTNLDQDQGAGGDHAAFVPGLSSSGPMISLVDDPITDENDIKSIAEDLGLADVKGLMGPSTNYAGTQDLDLVEIEGGPTGAVTIDSGTQVNIDVDASGNLIECVTNEAETQGLDLVVIEGGPTGAVTIDSGTQVNIDVDASGNLIKCVTNEAETQGLDLVVIEGGPTGAVTIDSGTQVNIDVDALGNLIECVTNEAETQNLGSADVEGNQMGSAANNASTQVNLDVGSGASSNEAGSLEIIRARLSNGNLVYDIRIGTDEVIVLSAAHASGMFPELVMKFHEKWIDLD